MNSVYLLMYTFVSAMVVENLMFARALGVDRIIERTRNYRVIAQFGAWVAVITTLGGILSWIVGRLFGKTAYWSVFKGLAIVFCLSLSFLLIRVLLHKVAAEHQMCPSDELLAGASFNGAAFGMLLLVVSQKMTLPATVAYCLGGSAGLTIAMLLVHSGRERLELSTVPKSFAGLPITLIYIGILSLAVYGLIGHQLPT